MVADTKMKMVLRISFFILNNTNIWFAEQKLVWRTNNITKAFSTTQKVEIISKKKFAAAALNEEDKIFMVHTIALGVVDSSIHLFWQT